MKSEYWKDILRSIKKSKKRFLAIMIITALGVTVLTGIYAACQDMFHSADRFYDDQDLFDIQILSTLGLTDEDVQALQQIDGIKDVDGAYSETVQTNVNNVVKDAEVSVLNVSSMNEPYVLEGGLPSKSGEIAVTQEYLDDTGKSIGDEVTIIENMDDSDEEDNTEDSSDDNSDWDIDTDIEEEEETPTFTITTFTITGTVVDPMDISNSSSSFRTSNGTEYTFYILAEDAYYDVYTTIYITLAGLSQLNCFSDEYEASVQEVIDLIEDEIKNQREQARYNEVLNDSLEIITEAEASMNESFADAEQQLADAWAEIEEAKQELTDGEAELTKEEKNVLQQLADARTEIENGKAQLRAAETELANGESELQSNAESLEEAKNQLAEQKQIAQAGFDEAELVLTTKQNELNTSLTQLSSDVEQLKQQFGEQWPENQWNALVSAASAKTVELLNADSESEIHYSEIASFTENEQNALAGALSEIMASWDNSDSSSLILECVQSGLSLGILNGSNQVLCSQKKAYETQKADTLQQIAGAEAEIEAGSAQIESARKQISDGKAEIEAGWAELSAGEEELDLNESNALQEIADAWREIKEGRQELDEGESELSESEAKYEEIKEEAEQKLADAYAELDDIDMTVWYVQDRTSLDSYSDLESDMSSIETVGNAFPVVFLIVAILISLTTMTRMVEEERGLIGTYKALGFSNAAIYFKYLFYAFLACIMGGIVGDIGGFIILPKILIYILHSLYAIPRIYLSFDVMYGVGGVLLFLVSVVVSTAIACGKELSQMPAPLMQPKAPKAGTRIFLERLPLVWNRLRFLNKVTARNLFRYKKRMFMTVLGIMGCTALILCGFAIRDSVTDLSSKQYDKTYLYDLMVVTDSEDNEDFIDYVSADANIDDYINLQIESIKLISEDGDSESVTLMVIPTGESIEDYINIRNTDGEDIKELSSEGIYVTQNAAELLRLETGGTVTLQTTLLEEQDVQVTGVVQNYLGNNAYITQELYKTLFGDYQPNGILASLSLDADDQGDYAESLLENDIVISSVSTEASRTDFSSHFTLLNAVVYLLIILAAGLAFVVLFTLSNTNISERNRELATIKVLGFFDREVHSYVNKETIILTLIGILIGLPVGRFISGLLTAALKMPDLYFAVYVTASSYLISALIAFCFAVTVNLMTNRMLNRVDMVEALKSVE
ncbi:MAG: FtsX-like permease family protein [Lachnospiraceae bacterium]